MKMPQMSFTYNKDIKLPPSLQLPKLFLFLAFPRKLYPSLIKLLFLKKSDKLGAIAWKLLELFSAISVFKKLT